MFQRVGVNVRGQCRGNLIWGFTRVDSGSVGSIDTVDRQYDAPHFTLYRYADEVNSCGLGRGRVNGHGTAGLDFDRHCEGHAAPLVDKQRVIRDNSGLGRRREVKRWILIDLGGKRLDNCRQRVGVKYGMTY